MFNVRDQKDAKGFVPVVVEQRVNIVSAGGAHVTSSENNSPIVIASEDFRYESCICITMFGKEIWPYV